MPTTPEVPDARQMHDHWWWRPGWTVGRSFYAWHLTFEGQPDLHALADRYQRALAGRPGLDLVPHRWLHLTVQGVGFTDEVPATNALAVTDAARRRLARLGPVRLTFHRPAVFTESVVLRPAPAEPVTQIRQQIRAAVSEVWGPDRVPEREEGFHPHVSIAYSNADQPARPVATALDRVDAVPAVVTVDHVSLIDLNRDDRAYVWRTVASAPLRDG